MKKTPLVLFLTLLSALCLLAGCGRGSAKANGPLPAAGPHGGVLAELGERRFTLEIVVDRTEGHLDIYTLDANAAQPVLTGSEGLELRVTVGNASEAQFLILAPIANAATQESAGSTTHYAGDAPWLKTRDRLAVTVVDILAQGRKYKDVKAVVPAAP